MTKEAEPTISPVLDAIKELSTSVDKRFTLADNRTEEIMEAVHSLAGLTEHRFDRLEGHVTNMESAMVTKDYLEKRLQKFQTTMVTKDYLDTKLANLEGNLIVLTRKEDQKLHTLVDILHDKRIIDDADVRRVERLEPFAR